MTGASGAGKSTLMRSITGLLSNGPDMVCWKGRNIGHLRADQIAKLGIAMVPEGRQLFPSLSVEENLIIGGQAVTATARGRINTVDLLDQLQEAGPGSFLIVIITALAAGTVFNIQVTKELSSMGASATVGGVLAVGLAREIAPLLTATLLTGKVATAYAAQLGTMKVTEQIDAITMLRTDPVEYLVVPRLIAMVVMAPVQCLLFFGVAIWSAQWSSTELYMIPPQVFWSSVRSWLLPDDIPFMLIKALVFGLQIAVISCGWGMTTRGGPKEVGTSTTGAVVMILVTVALMDTVLTQILFG